MSVLLFALCKWRAFGGLLTPGQALPASAAGGGNSEQGKAQRSKFAEREREERISGTARASREFKSRHSDQKTEMGNGPSPFFTSSGGWRFLSHLILHLRCKITATAQTAHGCRRTEPILRWCRVQSLASPFLLVLRQSLWGVQ